MTKTSRRTFGKQFTGAIAATALFSQSANTAGQTQKTTKRDSEDAKFYHQNTPPPIVIEDGSLNFSFKTTTPPTEDPSGNDYIYKARILGTGQNNIHHIRVLHGSGDLLYEDLEASGSTITIEIQETGARPIGEIKVEGSPDEVKVTSRKINTGMSQLRPGGATGMGMNRKHRFSHQGSGANDFRITSITIDKTDGSSQRFKAPNEQAGRPFSQEYRILIWVSR